MLIAFVKVCLLLTLARTPVHFAAEGVRGAKLNEFCPLMFKGLSIMAPPSNWIRSDTVPIDRQTGVTENIFFVMKNC